MLAHDGEVVNLKLVKASPAESWKSHVGVNFAILRQNFFFPGKPVHYSKEASWVLHVFQE